MQAKKEKKKNSQYKAFNILLKSELSEFSFFRLKGDIFSKITKLILLVVGFIALVFVYKFLLYFYETLGAKAYISFIPLIILFYTIVSVIQTLFGLSNQLFDDPRLEILITFPIKSYVIYLAKITTRYISELIKTTFFMLPLLIAFFIHVKGEYFDPIYIYMFKAFYLVLILPAFIILLSSILMFLFHYIKLFLSKSKIVVALLLLGIIIGIFIFITKSVNHLIDDDGFIRFDVFIKRWANLNYDSQKIIHETFINKWLYYFLFKNTFLGGSATLLIKPALYHIGIPLIYVGAMAVISLGLMYFIYFELLNSQKMNKIARERKINLFSKIKKIYNVFLLKEILSSIRDSKTLMQTVVYMFILPITSYFLNKIFFHLELSPFGVAMVFILNIFIGLLVVTTSNSLAAGMISKEGGMAPLLKIYPGNTKKIILAKISVNFILNISIIMMNAIILIVVNPFKRARIISISPLLITLILIIFSTINLLISSIEDLKKPEYMKYQYHKDINKIKNITNSIMLGMLISFVVSAIIILIGIDKLILGSSIIICVGAIGLGYIIYQYHKRLDVYFQGIGG